MEYEIAFEVKERIRGVRKVMRALGSKESSWLHIEFSVAYTGDLIYLLP